PRGCRRNAARRSRRKNLKTYRRLFRAVPVALGRQLREVFCQGLAEAGMLPRQRLKDMFGHVVLKHSPGSALDNVAAETHAVIRISRYFTARKHSPRLV